MSIVIQNLQRLVADYIVSNYSIDERELIISEMRQIVELKTISDLSSGKYIGYDTLQDALSTLNEKEYIRKRHGVYYTPSDVVNFITNQCVEDGQKDKCDFLTSTVFDPTCGAGEFLVFSLTKKFQILFDKDGLSVSKENIDSVVGTIFGNDINQESIVVSQIRLLICTLKYAGVSRINGVAKILKKHFTVLDFVANQKKYSQRFDIILGNPPYVEDGKCDTKVFIKYGNIYCNVLKNAVELLNPHGHIGFIIPLSYISTPRMEKIRNELKEELEYQKVYSFADRPDCLFSAVHQKLCILIGGKGTRGRIYTSAYKHWYKEERNQLFDDLQIYENDFENRGCIPKLGSELQANIYNKVINGRTSLLDLLSGQGYDIYLNLRACFWIKAFTKNHKGSEYKNFQCNSSYDQHLAMAILNSSLFWWFWNCVSDCWHITRKELLLFRLPNMDVSADIVRLTQCLENRLEITKKYVGTKQTDYEYKHKSCISEIDAIDICINKMFGLSEIEGKFIQSYARKAEFPKGKHIYNILAEKMLEPNGEIETAPNGYIITNIYTNKKVGFEYQGIQHYEAVDYFGGEEALKKRRELDELKAERCKFHGVKLLYWKYDEPLTDVVYFQKIKDLK